MKRPILLSLTALLFLQCFNAHAQQASFSGTWSFKDQQSISGNLYTNGSPKQVIIKQGNGVTIDAVVNYGEQDTTLTEIFSNNNKPFITKTPMGRRNVILLKWSDDHQSFAVTSTIYDLNDPNKVYTKETDVWKISKGNLILDRKSENYSNDETWESTATYTKN